MLSHFSHVWHFVTSWTVACQAPLSMGILQARMLEWVTIPLSRGSSWLRDGTRVSCMADGFFTTEPPAAAAAKSLQSCPTLCNPIDGSPPGSPIPGILQARTLEWVAVSFSNAWKWEVKVKSLSRVWLLATPWTAAYQAPPSMRFSRQEHWSGVPLPSPTGPPGKPLFIDGHLVFSHTWAIVYNAIINTGVHISLQDNDFISFGYASRSRFN